MIGMKVFVSAILAGIVLLTGACRTMEEKTGGEQKKIRRLFCWGTLRDEDTAARYAAAGVTDIPVHNRGQYELAVKYGITPYWRCFTPSGPYAQVMSPEETKHFDYVNGKDLDRKMPAEERRKKLDARRREVQFRYGGEPVAGIDTLDCPISCFSSDENLERTRKRLDNLLKDAPEGIAGMYLDYFGYMNHHGCYCEKCLEKYRNYLTEKKLEDTPENRVAFYRGKIVEYYDKVIDYIKSKHPDYKIVVHVYPDFRDDPLYGNRIKADHCGQTVSWYFKFDEAKIKRYTQYVVNHAKDYHSFAEGIPFIGLNADETSSLGYKTPEDVERDLRAILEAGGRTVMVCNGADILKPGYFEVFRKYCGKE